MTKTTTWWAIEGKTGLYYGGNRTRLEAIASHVHGRYRWTESQWPSNRSLRPMQAQDWAKCKRQGDRAVKVTVTY